MKTNLSYCGLNCDSCPIQRATLETDSGLQGKMRAAIAHICNEKYQQNLNSNDITDCDGCLADGRLFSACKQCQIRACARAKQLPNCAHCQDYPCPPLHHFFQTEPNAKILLDVIRAAIN